MKTSKTAATPKIDTLTVGQLLDTAVQLTRCKSSRHPTNVVGIRLTTRGLEVETTQDQGLVDRIAELERELTDMEDEQSEVESEANRLEEERDNLMEDVRTLESKVKELELQIKGWYLSKHPLPLS